MPKKETISGAASIVLGLGGGELLNFLGQSFWAFLVSIVFILAGAIMLIIAFRMKHRLIEPNLKIIAKVDNIRTVSFSEKMFGGYSEGDKELNLSVRFIPNRTMVLDVLKLYISGEPIGLDTVPVKVLNNAITLPVFFHIPKSLAFDTKDAKIYALSNGLESYSEPFDISFGG